MINNPQVIMDESFKKIVIYDMMWHNDVTNIIHQSFKTYVKSLVIV